MTEEKERAPQGAEGRRSPFRRIGCILLAFLIVFGGCTGYQMYKIASQCERDPLVSAWATTNAARASLEEKLAAIPDRRGRLDLTAEELNALALREIGEEKDERIRIALLTDGTVRVEASRRIDRPIIGTYYANASVAGLLWIEDGILRIERIDSLRDLRKTYEPPPAELVEELRKQTQAMRLRGVRSLRNEAGRAILVLDPAVGAAEGKGAEERPAAAPAPSAPTTGGGG